MPGFHCTRCSTAWKNNFAPGAMPEGIVGLLDVAGLIPVSCFSFHRLSAYRFRKYSKLLALPA